jgi:hypothetical protein
MRWLGTVVMVFLLGNTCAWGNSEDIPGRPHLRVANRDVAEPAPETIKRIVNKVRVYALMSELTYRNYSGGQPLTDQVRPEPGEKAQNLRDRQERARRWGQLDASLRKEWDFRGNNKVRCGSDDAKEIERDKKQEYLEFDIWVNKMTVPPQVVVALRGTDNDGDKEGHPGPRSEDLYAMLHDGIVKEKIVNACVFAGPGAVVSTTGHELGGGLAQHLFYASQAWSANNVKTAIVFEPSPTMAWDRFGTVEERSKAAYNYKATLAATMRHWKYPEVMAGEWGFGTIRINEGFSFTSSFVRQSEPEDPFMAALNFDFVNEYVSQHNMSDLAYNLYYFPESAYIPEHLKAHPENLVRDPLVEILLTTP